MGKISYADEILDEMAKSLGFCKIASEDAVAEFKSKLAAANTETAVDALYKEYKINSNGTLKLIGKHWLMLEKDRLGKLNRAKPLKLMMV